MKNTRKRFPAALAACLVTTALLVLMAAVWTHGRTTVENNMLDLFQTAPAHGTSLPALDTRIPEGLATATFAMG